MRINVGELFDGGISVSRFIAQMQEELTGKGDCPQWRFVEWLNIVQQLLYSEVIKYECSRGISLSERGFEGNSVDYCQFPVPDGIDKIRYSDIFAVKADGSFLVSGREMDSDMLSEIYFDKGGRLSFVTNTAANNVTVYFNGRPKVITDCNIDKRNIAIPLEFIDLLRCRIRSEFYKYVDEDTLSAKWTAEYNAILEDFKEWCSAREEVLK